MRLLASSNHEPSIMRSSWYRSRCCMWRIKCSVACFYSNYSMVERRIIFPPDRSKNCIPLLFHPEPSLFLLLIHSPCPGVSCLSSHVALQISTLFSHVRAYGAVLFPRSPSQSLFSFRWYCQLLSSYYYQEKMMALLRYPSPVHSLVFHCYQTVCPGLLSVWLADLPRLL